MRQRYADAYPGWRASGQVYEATVRQYVHSRTRVLDLGCGRGGLIELLCGTVALATGVDPELCSLVEHRKPAVNRVSGVAERLPFANGVFDLVITSWVLEHLVQPQNAFAEIARVLQSPDPAGDKPGGHFLCLTPNAWHPLTWASRLVRRVSDRHVKLVTRLYDRAEADTFPAVYRANTIHRIRGCARAAGLDLVTLYSVGDPTYLAFNELFYRLAAMAERLIPTWMKIHLVGDFVKSGRRNDSSR